MKNFINLGIFIPFRGSLLEFINSMDVACSGAVLQSVAEFAFCSLFRNSMRFEEQFCLQQLGWAIGKA